MAEVGVPQSVLKKRETQAKINKKREEERVTRKKANVIKRKVIFQNAEKYHKEYMLMEKDNVRLARQAKQSGHFFVPADAKVALVVRIRGINGMNPKTRKILDLLRLRQIHNAVFVKLNKPILNMMRKVEPYITYGYANVKTVRELLYKRGFANQDRQRIPITDNAVIEKSLGKFGIICMEDLIHEIVTCGPSFKQANNFLWPIKLSSPKGGYIKKGVHFIEGGDYGNREEFINQFVRRMN